MRRLRGQTPRMPGGKELRLEQLERDLDPVAHGDVGEIADPAALAQLLGRGLNVLGLGLAGEAHDHRGIQRLAGFEVVARKGPLRVGVVNQRAVVGTVQSDERRVQEPRGDAHRLARCEVRAVESVGRDEFGEQIAAAREPKRDLPQALAVQVAAAAARMVDPVAVLQSVLREQVGQHEPAHVLGQQRQGDPRPAVGSRPLAVVPGGESGGHLASAAYAFRQGLVAVTLRRANLEFDVAPARDADAHVGTQRNGSVVGFFGLNDPAAAQQRGQRGNPGHAPGDSVASARRPFRMTNGQKRALTRKR